MSNLLKALMDRMLMRPDRMAELAGRVRDNLSHCRGTGEVEVWATADNLEAYSDLSVLGQGHFSIAVCFKDEPDVVYKLGLKKEDSGAAYAAWCRANPGPHVPVIYDMRRYQSCYIVKMPYYHAVEVEDGKVIALANTVLMEEETGLWYNPATGCETVFQRDAYRDLPPALIGTLRSITKFFVGVATFDLHRDNAMWSSTDKATRRLIITDPVSFRAGYE